MDDSETEEIKKGMLTRKYLDGLAAFGQGGIQGNGRQANTAGISGTTASSDVYSMNQSVQETPGGTDETEKPGTGSGTQQPEAPQREMPGTGSGNNTGTTLDVSPKKGRRAWLWMAIGAAALWLAWVLFVKKR